MHAFVVPLSTAGAKLFLEFDARRRMIPGRSGTLSPVISAVGMAVGVGIVSGMRALLMPALVSRTSVPARLEGGFGTRATRFLRSPPASRVALLAAAGELVGDKLPFAPDRTESPAVVARAGSAAVMAALLTSWQRRPMLPSALVAAASAVVSAHLLIRLRREASRRIPDALAGAAEDCLAVSIGSALTRSAARE